MQDCTACRAFRIMIRRELSVTIKENHKQAARDRFYVTRSLCNIAEWKEREREEKKHMLTQHCIYDMHSVVTMCSFIIFIIIIIFFHVRFLTFLSQFKINKKEICVSLRYPYD